MAEPKRKSKRLWIAGGVALAAAALLVGVFLYLIHGPNVRDEFEATLTKLKSEGYTVTGEEHWPDCPDADNAWFLWKKTFGSWSPKGKGTAPTSFPEGARRVPPEQLLLNLQRDPELLTKDDKARLHDYFSATSDSLSTFETLASKSCFFNPKNKGRPRQEWETPRFVGVSAAFRKLVYCRGLMAVEDGDRGSALRLCDLALRFSRVPALPGDPMGGMLATALRSSALDLVRKALSRFPLSENEGQTLLADLDFRPFKEAYLGALDFDRLIVLEYCRELYAGKAEPGELGLCVEPGIGILFVRRSLGTDAALIQMKWVEILEAAREPYWEGEPKMAAIWKEVDGLSVLHLAPKAALPELYRFKGLARVQALSDVLRVAIACKLYAARTGKYPASQNELTPEFFNTTPLDPFTGHPFSYRVFPDGGFAVWSAGPNGIDETFATIPKDEKKRSVPPKNFRAAGDDLLFRDASKSDSSTSTTHRQSEIPSRGPAESH